MVIFCAILPVPPQADPAPRPDGEDVAKGVLEPREGVDGRAPRISSGLEGLRYIPRARPSGLILPDLQVLSTGPRGSPRASPPHHSFLPWGFLSGEETDRAVLWYHWQENDVRVVAG